MSLRSAVEIGGKITERLSFAAPLLTRLVIGQAFYITGRGKWGNLENVTNFFTSLGIPAPGANAVFISLLEYAGGAALMAGLLTRPVAFLLSCTMVVALMTADKEAFVTALGSDLTSVSPVVMLLSLVWLILYGAGPVSLDYPIFRRLAGQEKK